MKRLLLTTLLLIVLEINLTVILQGADFNGDGTDDIGVFRPSSGLWAGRDIARAYFGSQGDIPIPGDYHGDQTNRAALATFRPSTGLWAIRGLTRLYFGSYQDIPVPANYSGSSPARNLDVAVFRYTSGLWVIRGVTRCYYGTFGDVPISGYYPIETRADIEYVVEFAGIGAECKGIEYSDGGIIKLEDPEQNSWSHSFQGRNGDSLRICGYVGCYHDNLRGSAEIKLYINGICVKEAYEEGIDAVACISGHLRISDTGEAWFDPLY